MPVPRSRPGRIRLDCPSTSEIIELRCDGALLLQSEEPGEVAAKLAELGVNNPAPLVRAVRYFNAVEIDRSAQAE